MMMTGMIGLCSRLTTRLMYAAALALLIAAAALCPAGGSIFQSLRGISKPVARDLTVHRTLNEGEKCIEVLRPVLPKVALMFLVLDEMPHEALWTRWLDGIGNQLPAALLCSLEALACFKTQTRGGSNEVYDSQHLYTIYIHTKPDFEGYLEGSLFYKREVPAPIQTAWGDHSLATALRILLLEALKDPLNQRFQLLCPATIPIRPALFTYTQLIAEERSRVGWFWPRDRNFSDWAWRFPVPMLEEMPEIEGHTRFHRQFLTLSRGHAEVINSDSRIIRLFQRHCFIARETTGYFCVSDEQYVGTALSYYLGEAIAEEVTGDLAMAMATSGAGFAPEQVSMELLLQLRGSRRELTLLPAGNAYVEDHIGECRATERLNTTFASLKSYQDMQTACHAYEERGGQDRPTIAFPNCPFFARKFKNHTVSEVAELLGQLRIA